MQTTTVKLLINGKEVAIGHQFLEEIIRDIPDTKANKSIFDTLALSNNPEVRQDISRKDNLTKKTIHLLLNDENQDVVDNILSNSDLAKYIKEDRLLSIIKTDNIKYLTTIASNIENYEKCNLCKIIKILLKHKNPLVQYSIIKWRTSEIITTKTLKKLAKNKDLDISLSAKKELERR